MTSVSLRNHDAACGKAASPIPESDFPDTVSASAAAPRAYGQLFLKNEGSGGSARSAPERQRATASRNMKSVGSE